MITGMTFAKIAITLPNELAASARAAVKQGRASSVSAYVAAAVQRKVQDDRAVLAALYPELNPMENVWQTYDDILDACQSAWRFLIYDPDHISSIGAREWACASL